MAIDPPVVTDEMLQPFQGFQKSLLEFSELAAARLQVVFDTLIPAIAAMHEAIWLEYRQAGMPYGESDDGLQRWLAEVAEIQRLKRQAEYIQMHHQMLADFRQVIHEGKKSE